MTVSEVMREIEKDRIFFDESKGGVTLSGGEPMFQSEFLYELLKELKQQGYHVALDTCGYEEQNGFGRILPYVDLFLFDIKLIDDNEHIKYTGVSNQLILSNLRFLIEKERRIILRIPIIPDLNDTFEKWQSLSSLITSHPLPLPEIHLLPYHSIAKNKYQRFLVENKMPDAKDMRKEDLIHLKKKFEESGFSVKIGG